MRSGRGGIPRRGSGPAGRDGAMLSKRTGAGALDLLETWLERFRARRLAGAGRWAARPSYPLSVEEYRALPADYRGPVFVWDVDKTYLSTAFSSLRGLARIPVEFAVDKLAIPGMPEILRALRRGAGPGYACLPLYFISASPPQMRSVIEHKMLLDGVEPDGITCKDWLGALARFKPGRLREQVGFKLCALLEGRLRRPLADEYLFGDDAEKDPVAFHLYARIVAGSISPGEAQERVAAEGVDREARQFVFDLVGRLPRRRGRVERIFIHLEKGTPPERFAAMGDLLVPVRGACELALALYEEGLISAQAAREACLAAASARGEPAGQAAARALERGLIREARLREVGF